MSKFLDRQLDDRLSENLRFMYVRKVLLIMLENAKSEVLIEFMVKYHKEFDAIVSDVHAKLESKEIDPNSPAGFKQTFLNLHEQICVFSILESVYKKLSIDSIREFHKIVNDTPFPLRNEPPPPPLSILYPSFRFFIPPPSTIFISPTYWFLHPAQ